MSFLKNSLRDEKKDGFIQTFYAFLKKLINTRKKMMDLYRLLWVFKKTHQLLKKKMDWYRSLMSFLKNFQVALCFLCHLLNLTTFQKGIARTQSPTNKNCPPELRTFGTIVGISLTQVQWPGLHLGQLPSWSQLNQAAGKYAFKQPCHTDLSPSAEDLLARPSPSCRLTRDPPWPRLIVFCKMSSSSLAQWQFSDRWSNREVLRLLVENYTQYPARRAVRYQRSRQFLAGRKPACLVLNVNCYSRDYTCSQMGTGKKWKHTNKQREHPCLHWESWICTDGQIIWRIFPNTLTDKLPCRIS